MSSPQGTLQEFCKRYLIAVILTFACISPLKALTIVRTTNGDICTAVFPSAYQTISFSLGENRINNNKGFNGGQTNKTFIVGFNGSGFEFNPGAGTVTVTGGGLTIVSYVITSTTITVTITTTATNSGLNTISFNNIQVRATSSATASSTATLVRSGGTLLVNNKANKPGNNNHFGALSVSTPVAYVTSNATTSATTPVFTGTTGNQIIGMTVTVTGDCSSLSVTSFTITDASMNPSTNISNATIYYTGTINAFSTATTFGSNNSVTGGAFVINGTASLVGAGTYE